MRLRRPAPTRSSPLARGRVRGAMLLALGAVPAAAPTGAGAQAPAPAADVHAHRGFWIAPGLGPGLVALGCDADCGAPRSSRAWGTGTGGGFRLAMGGTARPDLLLGGELGAIVRSNGGSDAGLVWMSFVSQWYPRPRSGLHLRGGLGIGAAVLEDRELGILGEQAVTTSGFTVQAGVGYDVRFGRFAVSPFAEYVQVVGDGDETRLGGRTLVGPSYPGALQIGLRLPWY